MIFCNKEVVTMGLFDVTKAFHCKTFDVFIKKLELYGVLAYHEIYLSGRKRLNSVPQGSVLGRVFTFGGY